MAHTAWAVLPPLITIILALWTKEVYMSLLIGIFSHFVSSMGAKELYLLLHYCSTEYFYVGS